MTRPRAADDFATIRARMEELRRERETAELGKAAGPTDAFHPKCTLAAASDHRGAGRGPTVRPDTQLVEKGLLAFGASGPSITSARRRRRDFSGSRSGEVSFNLLQHPRQRDGEREEGSV